MGRVNLEALEQGLQTLEDAGVIAEWQARPLRMYWIRMPSGELLRPDVKETAMWVMGALQGNAVAQGRGLPEDPIDRRAIARGLGTLQDLGVIAGWTLNQADDYDLRMEDGGSGVLPAKTVWPWVIGASVAWKVINSGPLRPEDRQKTETQLDSLRALGVIESWTVEDGQYAITMFGAVRPTTTGPRETSIWSDGALIAALIGAMKQDIEEG